MLKRPKSLKKKAPRSANKKTKSASQAKTVSMPAAAIPVSPATPPPPVKIAPKGATKLASTSIRSLADSIHDIAGTILFEAGFDQSVIDRAEVVEILRFLEDCREEGRALYPEILLTTDLHKCLHGVHPLRIVISGDCEDRPGRFRRALKKCAAIATEPWVVVLEVSKQKVRYGFASANVRADSISLYEAVLEARTVAEDAPPFVFMRRFGSRAVWLKSMKTEQVISLTLSEELLRASEHINSFAKIVVENLHEPIREKTLRLVSRLIQEACREGHGFIVCAVHSEPDSIDACKRAFSDGSWLTPPIDLVAPTVDQDNAPAALEGDSTLRAGAAIARRMIEMDLMTMFSTAATVVGYNIHIASPHSATITGGARTRAFAALMEKPSLRAAFMCSQDGQTHFQEFPHAETK